MTRDTDPPGTDVTNMRVMDTSHSLTEEELATLKDIVRNYNHAKWAVTIMLSLGGLITGIVYYFMNHFNIIPKG